MKEYNIRITNKALNDLEEIYNYILNVFQSPETAINQYRRIATVIRSLSIFPERIKIMESKVEKEMRLRQIRVDNYSIFYVIQGDSVIVTRVIYSASDIGKRLVDK